jgi:spore coat protein A
LALPVRPRLPGLGPSIGRAAPPQAFEVKLPIPDVRTEADIALEMREAEVPIFASGPPTEMWTYDGSFPGPTIRRPSGEETEVTFTHSLPSEAGELTVHLHGGHNISDHDGQPGAPPDDPEAVAFCKLSGSPANDAESPLLISPQETRTYVYPLTEDGEPERAAFQWYHDHRCHRTSQNIWRGLAGMWILDDDFDDQLPLPRGERDIPLMITDRSFDRRNQLTDPFGTGHAPNDGIPGKVTLVNGAHLPHHRVDARRYRLRLLNASGFRSYHLGFSNGASMVQIATEAGLMPSPVKRRRILLGPGERAEVIVDFGEFPHRDVRLVSSQRSRGPDSLGSKAYEGPLMQFRVGGRRPDSTRVPRELRPLPDWVNDASPTPQKTWTAGIGGFSWVINGRTYDPAYVEHEVDIDTTETWRLKNASAVAHLIHLHHTDWYMLSRNGRAPNARERCLKETFFLDPHDEVVVAGHFSDHPGKFIVHCHMLDHEDHGLMSQFEVVEPAPR